MRGEGWVLSPNNNGKKKENGERGGDAKPRKLETAELRDEMGGVERRMLLM